LFWLFVSTVVLIVNVRTHFRLLDVTTPQPPSGPTRSSATTSRRQRIIRNQNSTTATTTTTANKKKKKKNKNNSLIDINDRIYSKNDWDSAPIVVPEYKLVFFTVPEVGARVWKQAFRRMERYEDWNTTDWKLGLPNDPQQNGLTYLYNYTLEEAESIMTSPEWTRAIFVMSPKDRFLSVFRSLRRDRGFVTSRCCPRQRGCHSTLQKMTEFVELMETCYSSHWAPLVDRIDDKWWPYINFVGSLENVEDDSKRLLDQVGAWDDIGSDGWGGHDGQDRIFASNKDAYRNAREMIGVYTPQVGRMLDKYYSADYSSRHFKFKSKGVWALRYH